MNASAASPLPTPAEAVVLLGLSLSAEEFVATFAIPGPALISFSGGRTSALMLWCILVAHRGQLPADVVVAFENTGKEREETLRFVFECGSRWGVPIRWLEWREGDEGFEEVGYNSASRNGEPFEALIRERRFAPNAVARFCSVVLKVRTAASFCRAMGWERWINVVGLRYDEGHRVLKALARNDFNKESFKAAMPLSKAKITKRTVLAFWLGPSMKMGGDLPQGFDLGLRDYEGNCDLCFLKSRAKKRAIIRENPGVAEWWVRMEALAKEGAKGRGGTFVTEYSVADLVHEVEIQPHLFDELDDEEYDTECGLHCATDEVAA